MSDPREPNTVPDERDDVIGAPSGGGIRGVSDVPEEDVMAPPEGAPEESDVMAPPEGAPEESDVMAPQPVDPVAEREARR